MPFANNDRVAYTQDDGVRVTGTVICVDAKGVEEDGATHAYGAAGWLMVQLDDTMPIVVVSVLAEKVERIGR